MNTLLSATSINGTDVKNASGENLGQIKDLMIDTSTGELNYAVVSFGGFLGIGDKYFAIPWKAFSVDRNNEEMILNVSKERLQQAPGFDKDHWPTHANHEYLTNVNKYYSAN